MPQPLPIDDHLPRIRDALRRNRTVVVVAPPGAGKTTRIPPALVADGAVILLQPRRMAARALARRIAAERGWTVGREVGWQVRFERRFSERTRLLVATEGVLTARLQTDPLLGRFRTVVLDEFHERSLHADLALALVREAAQARDDLRVVVMSATLDAAPVARYLGGAPVVDVPGRSHPLEIEHAPTLSPATAIRRVLDRDGGHLLCFLPGAPEIRRVAREVGDAALSAVDLLPLHGSLDADAQDAALAPTRRRKLILATNIAETSLTVEGVSDVIDSGLHKVLRRDEASGLDRLETERISRDSAEQRAGRAGRTGPGRVLRLWDPRDRLRPHREPEIRRVDLAGTCLEILAWGGDPRSFAWFDAPPSRAIADALELLTELGALREERITELGRLLRRFPLHPRLARLLVGTGSSGAAACAVLSERWTRRDMLESTRSDLLALADRLATAPPNVRRAARELQALARRLLGPSARDGRIDAEDEEERLLRAVLAAYPDRVARRREPGSRRLLLASGHGALLAEESGVRDPRYLVALDVAAGARGPGSEARVRLASGIESAWLEPTRVEQVHRFDADAAAVQANRCEFHHELLLTERAVPPDPDVACELLVEALLARGIGTRNEALLRRLRFAGIEPDLPALLRSACLGRHLLPELDLRPHLSHDQLRRLERLAPETLSVPSGRRVRLEYREDGGVVAAVKLQELFGLADSPRVGTGNEPVTFSLLAPNGRPVQTTRDLRSFWDRTYPEVRRELRGRYAKHPWPEDPWNATPTSRTKHRKR